MIPGGPLVRFGLAPLCQTAARQQNASMGFCAPSRASQAVVRRLGAAPCVPRASGLEASYGMGVADTRALPEPDDTGEQG